jgi:hypothetical protein
MIGFISTSVTSFLFITYNQYIAIADLHTFQFTVTHALRFSVFTGRLLATYLNAETSASNHSEIFLLFRLQSLCNFGAQIETLLDSWSLCLLACYYCRLLLSPPAYDCLQTTFVVPYKPSARTYRKTSCGRYPLLCNVTAYAECLPSRCLEMCWHATIFKYACKFPLLFSSE